MIGSRACTPRLWSSLSYPQHKKKFNVMNRARRLLSKADMCSAQAHVRFGSKADICGATSHVRFTPNSDRESGFPQTVMSALPPKADICGATRDVCFGPSPQSIIFFFALVVRLRTTKPARVLAVVLCVFPFSVIRYAPGSLGAVICALINLMLGP
jgi:hypothetical protein